jgi:hypothetical protein
MKLLALSIKGGKNYMFFIDIGDIVLDKALETLRKILNTFIVFCLFIFTARNLIFSYLV